MSAARHLGHQCYLRSALSTHLRFEKCSVYSVFELSTQSVSAENFAGCTSWVALDVFVADMLPSLLLKWVEVAVVAFEPGAAASAFAAVAVVDVVVVVVVVVAFAAFAGFVAAVAVVVVVVVVVVAVQVVSDGLVAALAAGHEELWPPETASS